MPVGGVERHFSESKIEDDCLRLSRNLQTDLIALALMKQRPHELGNIAEARAVYGKDHITCLKGCLPGRTLTRDIGNDNPGIGRQMKGRGQSRGYSLGVDP